MQSTKNLTLQIITKAETQQLSTINLFLPKLV
jgi:hypothetical protein